LLKVVQGEAALVFSDGEESTIMVSDLHLGMEKEMARRGFRIPPHSMKMVTRIRDMADRFGASRIVILGDVKHSVGKVEDIDWSVLPWFFGAMLDMFSAVDVIPGNHDGGLKALLPPKVRLHGSEGLVIGEGREAVGAAHGHAWPSQQAIETGNLVIGHSHFTYEMKDRFGSTTRESVWLFGVYSIERLAEKAGYSPRRRGKGRLVVMPPFNRMVGGQPINRKGSTEFGPVLASGCVDLTGADVFLLDGTRVS
jgi:putative SbcD/Mre11-related phosphoesterase